jgi:flagellar hook-associated protein 3 FlgL
MRVTNNMILRNSSYNINATKESVDSTATQMTTQKKISRPSEDPVTAIRSLRLSTSLTRVNQYYKKNIPDASSWLDVTETALNNMKTLMTDVRTQVVYGATDTLTQDDRNTILTQLKALQTQLYSEGNADYAGRTVFTGFRTDSDLVFAENETDTSYTIEQNFSSSDIESFSYYAGNVEVPTTMDEVMNNDISDTQKTSYYRLYTSYNDVDSMNSFSYSYENAGVTTTVSFDLSAAADGTAVTAKDADGNDINGTTMTVYETEEDWWNACKTANGDSAAKTVDDDAIVFIKETGHIILGNNIAADMKSNKATISSEYDKTGFDKGELKPEYYFNCTNKTDPANPVSYQKYDADGNEIGYDINYTVASNQTLTVNLEASDAFNSDILRDMDDMISAVSRAMNAHDKIDSIKSMMSEAQYDDDESQAKLNEWLDAAQKEADYADDNLQKLFDTELGKVDGYLSNITLALTKVGCTADQLELTETRMSNQQETIQELQSENDDMDLSEIIINYTAVYNAYQASLTAASKLGDMTLLNYI